MLGVLLNATLPVAYAMEPHLQASLLTCSPGPEVYELFGHEALRIRGIDEKGLEVDTVWNYGVFDFAAPNFLYRFVKGETDYMVEPCPMNWFMGAYVHRGSGVTEQDLNLTTEETLKLRKLLQINSMPANRTYRYNYVRDNCATRPAAMIDSAVAPRKIIYPREVSYGSFREAMRDFHKDYPWYQFGIDLVLGSGLDKPLKSEEELFAPLLMEQKVAEAYFADGQPLVASTRILYPGVHYSPKDNRSLQAYYYALENRHIPLNQAPDMETLRNMGSELGPTPFLLSPLFISLLLFAGSVIISLWQYRTHKIAKWAYTIFFSLLGITGCVVWFLVFFSSHEATSPNILSLWLNPLQLVVAITVWWRHTRPVAVAMSVVNLVILIILICSWPLQSQVANPAVFPLWGVTLALSLSLFLTTLSRRNAEGSTRAPRSSRSLRDSRVSRDSRSPRTSRSTRTSKSPKKTR